MRRSEIRESTALALAGAGPAGAAAGCGVEPLPARAALRIDLNGASLIVPAGFPEAELASALRAVASL